MEMQKKTIGETLCLSSKDIHRYLEIRSQYPDWARRRNILNSIYPVREDDPFDAWIPLETAVEIMVQDRGDRAKKIRTMLLRGRSLENILETIESD